MLQVGNLQGPLASAEARTHFGAWCIVSSPLILGMDLTDEATMAAVWPYVSNTEAIAVNQAWEGDPGRLLNHSSDRNVEVWAKRQPKGALALLAINTATTGNASVSLDLRTVLPTAAAAGFHLRDVWEQRDLGPAAGGVWAVQGLAPHDSAFVLVSVPQSHM